jgi:uncharacterized repeat protein (TIGR01451 family)
MWTNSNVAGGGSLRRIRGGRSWVRNICIVAVGLLAVGMPAASAKRQPTTGTGLRVDDVRVLEGDSGSVNAVVTVTLGAPVGNVVTVDVRTEEGTATADLDYASVSTRVVFGKRQTTATVLVPVIGDAADEPDEQLSVRLSNAVKATIDDPQGTVTITDDDDPPPPPASPADLRLVLSDDELVDQLLTGDTLRYTLAVTNLGPGAAVGGTVVDRLPDGVTFLGSDAGCSLAADGETVTCTAPADLAPGATWSPWIDASLDRTDLMINTAQVTSATPDPSTANNVDSEATNPIAPNAEVDVTGLSIGSLDGSQWTPWVGHGVVVDVDSVYLVKVTLTNHGPTRADGVEAELFDEETHPSVLGTACVAAPSRVPGQDPGARASAACSVGSLAAGASVEVAFTLAFDPEYEPRAPEVPYSYELRDLFVDVRSSTAGQPAGLYDGTLSYSAAHAGRAWLVPECDAPETASVGEIVRVSCAIRNLGPWQADGPTVGLGGTVGAELVEATGLDTLPVFWRYPGIVSAGETSNRFTFDLRYPDQGTYSWTVFLEDPEVLRSEWSNWAGREVVITG